MAKLLIGFLLGIAAASGFYFLFDTERLGSRDNPDAQVTEQSPVDVTTERPPAETRNDHIVEPGEQEPSTDSVKPEMLSDGGQSTSEHQAEQSANRASSNSAAVSDNSYSPEIKDMIENRVDPELQARYEGDSREDSWATYMEGQLANYFGSKPELAQFDFSSIDCRTSMCSVHALGYGPQALTQWNMATSDLVPQQWHDFKNMSMNRHNPAPDILAIVLILSRTPGE
jgi:hypothetical protein